jgi:lysyl-tRNA synthetase class 2
MTINRENLKLRSAVLQAIRSFFIADGFVEVETPVRIPAPALEDYIDAFACGEWYLRTSPELHMKRLLAAGMTRIFQMGSCFRSGEKGQRHNPEFTMLEWYRANADYMDILADTESLLRHVAQAVLGSTQFSWNGEEIDLSAPWQKISVADAFERYAGWNPVHNFDADRFDLDLVNKVEPALPRGCGVVLVDYPAEAAALARRKADAPELAERWELYLNGLELANAFSELVDADEQLKRFEECAAKRAQAGYEVYPIDRPFIAALKKGMPPSGGIAVGIDRLVMLLADSNDISQVRAFSSG